MEAVLHVLRRQRQVVTEIQDLVTEVGKSKCRHDVPDAEKPNLRVRLNQLVGSRVPDATFQHVVAEVQGGRGSAAEADDVNGGVAGRPRATEMRMRFLDP